MLPFAIVDTIPMGKIGLNKKFREFLVLSLIDQVYVQVYDEKETDRPATSISLKVEMLLPPSQRTEINDADLIKHVKQVYLNHYVAIGQLFVVDFQSVQYILSVEKVMGG